jgi:hypothetical protein
MRHTLVIASLCASCVSLGAFASEKGSMSIAVSGIKIGQSSQTVKPVEGDSTTTKTTYLDYLGETADAAVANLELGFHYKGGVFYFYPLGAQGERELWVGMTSGENLEWGLVTGGFTRSYDKAQNIEGKKLKEDGLARLGLFANYKFQMFGHDFETSDVLFYELGETKYENSNEDLSGSRFGLRAELLYTQNLAENMTAASGITAEWSSGEVKVNDKKAATTTDFDIGLQIAKLTYSF